MKAKTLLTLGLALATMAVFVGCGSQAKVGTGSGPKTLEVIQAPVIQAPVVQPLVVQPPVVQPPVVQPPVVQLPVVQPPVVQPPTTIKQPQVQLQDTIQTEPVTTTAPTTQSVPPVVNNDLSQLTDKELQALLLLDTIDAGKVCDEPYIASF